MPRARTADRNDRRRELLTAALEVFLRFGFRKASMEEVARAAQLSRQALYLHFRTKEALFRAALAQVLETSLASATLQLSNPKLSAEQKLVRAFDEWVGRFVGVLGSDAQDLAEATSSLGKSMVSDHERHFVGAVIETLRNSGLAAAYKPCGLSAPQLARSLFATARGLKYECTSRQEFRREFERAVRAFCLPLGDAS
jgi:AcrR family transcriptional regulator